MQKHLLIPLFVTLFSIFLKSQPVFHLQNIEGQSSKVLDEQFSAYQLSKAPAAALNKRLQGAQGQEVRLKLKLGRMDAFGLSVIAHDLRAPGYQLIVAEAQGKRALPKSPNKTYRGHLAGPAQGRVRLTVDQNFLYGYIEKGHRAYFVEPAWLLDPSLPEGTYVWYEAAAVKAPEAPKACGTKHDHRLKPGPAPNASRQMMQCYSVGMGLAADFQLFNALGSATATENFMLGVLNNVGTNYDDEFSSQVEFIVNGTFVSTCASCDPWTGSGDASALLDSFTNWGNSGGFGFNHSLATLWTDRNFDGETIGIAWVGGLCTFDRYNTCERFASNAALLRLLQAHEIGHNFNASHSASGSNTIMAPSVSTSNNWSSASTATINSYINAQSGVPGCFGVCGAPTAPPEAAIGTPVEEACPGSYIQFIDETQNNPTSWSWSFTGGVPSSSNQQHPVVYYPESGTYIATLNATNAAGGSFSVSNIITVQEGNAKYLFYDAMEGNLNNWTVDNPDNSVTWAITNVGGASFGQQAAYMNNYSYDAEGQKDALITPVLDFSEESGMRLIIDYAYQRYSLALTDELRILISTDGGSTYPDEIFFGEENGGGNYSTAPDGTDLFVPTVPADWCFAGNFGADCLNLNLSAYSGEPEVRIKIENTNGFGNNLYIDNVQVISSCFVLQPPAAVFAADAEEGCAPLTVQFTDLSQGEVDAWAWSFPGGMPSSSNEQNPTVEYPVPGAYPVSLTVSNAAGSSTTSLDTDIEVQGLPEPFFLYNIDGFTVAFGNLSDGYTDVEWAFGDGEGATVDAPTHTYAEPGTYTVRLLAQNKCGTAVYTEDITILPPPTAAFYGEALSGCAPVLMQFINTSTFGESFSWTFENGNPATSTDPDPICSFAEPGTYQVTLVATNGVGSDTITQVITVAGGPQSGFIADYTPGSLTVSFQNTSLDAFAFEWDFGDGSPGSSDFFPVHTYTSTGIYTVTLVATNDCGSDTTMQDVTVVLPPIARFSIPQDTACAPYTIAPAHAAQGTVDSWLWIANGANPDTATVPGPTFTFDSAGIYEIILQVTNAAGTSLDTSTLVLGSPPVAGFLLYDTLGSPQISTENLSVDADSYTWSFGDGNTSNEAAPAHTYTEDGNYTLTLVAENTCGADTLEQSVIIVTPPVAAIGNADTSGCTVFTFEPVYDGSANVDAVSWSAPGSVELEADTIAPVFTYDAPGVYALVLEVSNAAGNDTDTLEVAVGTAPNADFEATVPPGSLSLSVINNSEDATTYSWAFGDGSNSNEVTPQHTYAGDGAYNIQLVVSNACGTDTSQQGVEVITAPIAGTTPDTAAGCAPLTVNLSSTASANATSVTYTALGADPNMSNDPNPSFTYAAPGDYSIIQTVSNAAGSSNDTLQISVGAPPQAGFEADIVVGSPQVSFISSSTGASAYQWDFGDGSTSTDVSPEHTYTADGVYMVYFIAANTCGSDTALQEVEIMTAPTAGFTTESTEGCAPFTLNLINTASTNANTITYTAVGAVPPVSTDPAPTLIFPSAGQYTIVQQVSNAAGSSADTLLISVNDAPDAAFTGTIALGSTLLEIENTSQAATGYQWSFGDGNESASPEPAHAYEADGDYTVTLIASNTCGADTVMQAVAVITPPSASILLDTVKGCLPFTLSPVSTASANATALLWTAPGATPGSATGAAPEFTYAAAGTYTLYLETSNAAGISLDSATVEVLALPMAAFTAEVTGFTVTLSNNSTAAQAYDWGFGDGSNSNEVNPVHTYDEAGAYPVVLTAINECGQVDTTVMVTIAAPVPMAAFEVEGTNGCAPFEVAFSNNSQFGEGYEWAFPGGSPTSSTAENPTVVYEAAGTYSVMLIVSNTSGADTMEMADLIVIGQAPNADFEYSVDAATVSFANTTVGADSFLWRFGDGSTSTAVNPLYDYGAAGAFEAMLVAANECGADTLQQIIEIVGQAPNPVIAFGSPLDPCAPLTLELYASSEEGTPADSWQWLLPGGTPSTASGDTVSVAYTGAGVYTIALIGNNTFGTDTLTLTDTISLEEAPVAGFIFETEEGDVTFTSTSEGTNLFFEWDFGDGSTSTDMNPEHSYSTSGLYTVSLTVANACDTVIMSEVLDIMITSNTEWVELQAFEVFPNPNRGRFTVQVIAKPEQQLHCQLYNVVGQKLKHYEVDFQTGRWQQDIDTSQLPAGVYLLEVRIGQHRAYRRVVIE